MTLIELPNEVVQELLLAANSKNKTVGDYIIFLMQGDNHLGKNLTRGVYHPETQTTSSTPGCKPGQTN